jgi:hypothetical protein
MKKKYWFWAWLTQITLPKGRLRHAQQKGEVWRNLVLVSGRTEKEAIRKAEKIGAGLEGDSRGSLTLDGQPAMTKFVGIEDMGLVHDLIYDELSDGVEILFTEKRTSIALARKRVRGSKAIETSLAKELQPYIRLAKKRK